MIMKKVKKWVVILFLVIMTNGQTNVNDANDGCPFDLGINYLVVGNVADNNRTLGVFMDERAYSKENLERLFKFLSAKYPHPDGLYIYLETSWDRVPSFSENCQGSGISGVADDTRSTAKYSRYFRYKNKEHFIYVPNSKTREVVKLRSEKK